MVDLVLLLRRHPRWPRCHDWHVGPADWIASFGEIAKFCARVMGAVFSGRVFHFFGEALRQAGILILGSPS